MMDTSQKTEAASPVNLGWDEAPWSRLSTAISQRFAHIDPADLKLVDCDVYAVEDFLRENTEASNQEIESLVREFTGSPSVMRRVEHSVESATDAIVPTVRDSVDRVRYELDEHRGVSSALTFIAGVTVGVALAGIVRREPAPRRTWW